TPSGKLPPVLPIVLYNGDKKWSAARNVESLIETIPGGLEQYRPQLHYLLLDEGAIVHSADWPGEARNLVAGLFRLEHNCDEQDMLDVLGRLVEWLKVPEQTALRRAFVVWIRRVLLPNQAPGMELPEFNNLHDLHEVHDMLSERIKKWPDRWLEEGRQEGKEEGELEARREIARNLIKRTGMSNQSISEIANLPAEEIAALRAECQH
ncbi:MAG: Rpn family recombination-promoting nuclease/putative transposase, partial [Alteromonadaceae bacterium]|nr:Rpn family recombination-promoting nuclease/putative transposase [Alteromonadaceae bacterium]